MHPATGLDTFVFPLQGEPRKIPFVRTDANEWLANFSPDTRWVAYVSDVSGAKEVYVKSFPPGEKRWQISTEGGTEPIWSPHGRELFFREGLKMMAVDVQTDPVFQVSRPRVLFEGPYEVLDGPLNYDVTPDGQRFLMVKIGEKITPPHLRVVSNWFHILNMKSPR